MKTKKKKNAKRALAAKKSWARRKAQGRKKQRQVLDQIDRLATKVARSIVAGKLKALG